MLVPRQPSYPPPVHLLVGRAANVSAKSKAAGKALDSGHLLVAEAASFSAKSKAAGKALGKGNDQSIEAPVFDAQGKAGSAASAGGAASFCKGKDQGMDTKIDAEFKRQWLQMVKEFKKLEQCTVTDLKSQDTKCSDSRQTCNNNMCKRAVSKTLRKSNESASSSSKLAATGDAVDVQLKTFSSNNKRKSKSDNASSNKPAAENDENNNNNHGNDDADTGSAVWQRFYDIFPKRRCKQNRKNSDSDSASSSHSVTGQHDKTRTDDDCGHSLEVKLQKFCGLFPEDGLDLSLKLPLL